MTFGDEEKEATSVRRLGRDAAIYGVGFVLQRAAGLIMLPIYTRYLVPADYATLHLLQMSLDVAAILLSAGLTAGVLRFASKAEDEREGRAVFVAALWMTTLFNVVGAVALVLAADSLAEHVLHNPGYSDLVLVVAASFVLEPVLMVPTILMQATQRAGLYTVVSAVRLGLQLALNVVFVVFLREGVRGIVLSTLLTYLVLAPVLVIWMIRRTGLPFSRRAAGDLLRFGLPYRITEAGNFVLTYVDRYFLVALHGLAVTGVYSLAYQFGFVLVYLGPTPFLLAWDPQRFRLVKRPKEERDPVYDKGFLYLSVLLLTLAVGISLFVTPTLTVMANPEYHGAAGLVPIVLLAYVFNSWSRVFELSIQVSERTLWATYGTWIAVALIVMLYAILIPPYGALGAALATVLAFACRALVFFLFGQRLWPVAWTFRRHVLLLAGATALVSAYFAVEPEGLTAELLLAGVLTVVWFVFVLFGGPLSSEDRRALGDWLRARLGRGGRTPAEEGR